jgi:hypothetical protein
MSQHNRVRLRYPCGTAGSTSDRVAGRSLTSGPRPVVVNSTEELAASWSSGAQPGPDEDAGERLAGASAGFIITITLSAADATACLLENPFTPAVMHGRVLLVTFVLVGLRGAAGGLTGYDFSMAPEGRSHLVIGPWMALLRAGCVRRASHFECSIYA